jgi:hypothetical protein
MACQMFFYILTNNFVCIFFYTIQGATSRHRSRFCIETWVTPTPYLPACSMPTLLSICGMSYNVPAVYDGLAARIRPFMEAAGAASKGFADWKLLYVR